MPNWCNNVVTFTHNDPKLIARLVKGFNKGAMMSEFFPCPKELLETMSGAHLKGTEQALEHEIQQKVNTVTYGAANWYDWQVNNWGTKWDVGRREYDDKVKVQRGAKEVTLTFDSAWSPPIQFYEKMEAQQQFLIDARYFEPGGGFIGRWENGSDETYNFEETNRAWIEDNVPAELLEEFGVLDFFDPDEENKDEDEE